MGTSYAYEKAFKAITGMATSPASLQRRVGDAYIFNLIHVTTEDMTDDLRPLFAELRQRLTKEEDQEGVGTVNATVAKMATEEAQELAELVFRIFDRLCVIES